MRCVLDQLPELHRLMIEACTILNIESPDLYVRQSPVPNAYTLAISGKKPFVVVHTSLVELLTRKELQVSTPASFSFYFLSYQPCWVCHLCMLNKPMP